MNKSNHTIQLNPEINSGDNEQKIRSGASWFYWIAGLSILNSILLYTNQNLVFVIGLGITQLTDAIAMEFINAEPGASATIKAVALTVDILVSVILVMFGWLANKKNKWAFICGMTAYFLDGLIFLKVQDWMSIGFHLFALFFIFKGYSSLKDLLEKEARAGIKPSGKGGARCCYGLRLVWLEQWP